LFIKDRKKKAWPDSIFQAIFIYIKNFQLGVVPMECTTVRKGSECPFMAKQGCSYNGGICHETIESCDGCNRKLENGSGWFCSACPDPAQKWKNGNCNLASHVTTVTTQKKQKVNPLKASKRARR
jgi:hypothetical protein